MSTRDKESPTFFAKAFLAGGIAGCAAKTVVGPLDRVKILFQTANPDFQKDSTLPGGFLRATRRIYEANGVRGLFQGHSATMLRIFPYAAIKFMSYEEYKRLLPQSRASKFVAGSLAGVTSVIFSYPLELLRVRLAYQQTTYPQLIQHLWNEPPYVSWIGPISSFYRGLTPTLLGMIPYAGVSFFTYELLIAHCGPLVSGGISGVCAMTIAYPFEVLRRHIQVAKGNRIYQAAQRIFQERGIRGFYVGIGIGYIKVAPMFATSFYTYEILKKLWRI